MKRVLRDDNTSKIQPDWEEIRKKAVDVVLERFVEKYPLLATDLRTIVFPARNPCTSGQWTQAKVEICEVPIVHEREQATEIVNDTITFWINHKNFKVDSDRPGERFPDARLLAGRIANVLRAIVRYDFYTRVLIEEAALIILSTGPFPFGIEAQGPLPKK